jgi:tetratricopeptide (TPR) repeat protein
VSGKKSEALRILDKLIELSRQRYVDPYDFAVIYTGLGEIDKAFEWLNKGYEARAPQMVYLKKNS